MENWQIHDAEKVGRSNDTMQLKAVSFKLSLTYLLVRDLIPMFGEHFSDNIDKY